MSKVKQILIKGENQMSGKVLLVATAIIAVSPLLAATTNTLAEPADDSPEITSVIVKLEKECDAFRDLLQDEVTPKIQEIAKTLRAEVQRANVLLSQLKSDPNSSELASQYEDCLSRALAKASSMIEQFGQTEPSTFQALARVEIAVKEAIATFTKEAETAQSHAEDFKAKAKNLESQLRQLAEKLKPTLESQEELPLELDTEIRCLETNRQVAEFNSKISQTCSQNATEAVKALDKQKELLSRFKGDLRVAFNTASGQRLLVANLCRAREQGLTARHLLSQLKAVQSLGLLKTGAVEAFDSTLQWLLSQGLNPVGIYAETPEVVLNQAGAAILRKYLTESSPEEEPNEPNK